MASGDSQVAHDVGTADGLPYPREANNLRASQIGPLEQVSPTCSFFHVLFHFIGMLDHSNRLVWIEVASRRCEPEKGGSSTSLIATADLLRISFYSMYSFWLPTCHQGDSGASATPIAIGSGQIH